jgi:hypothetical protein
MNRDIVLQNFFLSKNAGKIDPTRTRFLDKHPSLKGGQDNLPDSLQAKIINKKRAMQKKAEQEDFTYDRKRLRNKTQRNLGRGTGAFFGGLAGGSIGKSKNIKAVLGKTLAGSIVGGTAGHFAGPKVFGVSDEMMDGVVYDALRRNRKNRGTGRNSSIVRELKRDYNLKVHPRHLEKSSSYTGYTWTSNEDQESENIMVERESVLDQYYFVKEAAKSSGKVSQSNIATQKFTSGGTRVPSFTSSMKKRGKGILKHLKKHRAAYALGGSVAGGLALSKALSGRGGREDGYSEPSYDSSYYG